MTEDGGRIMEDLNPGIQELTAEVVIKKTGNYFMRLRG